MRSPLPDLRTGSSLAPGGSDHRTSRRLVQRARSRQCPGRTPTKRRRSIDPPVRGADLVGWQVRVGPPNAAVTSDLRRIQKGLEGRVWDAAGSRAQQGLLDVAVHGPDRLGSRTRFGRNDPGKRARCLVGGKKSGQARDDLAEPKVQRAGEPIGVGADASQPDRPLRRVNQEQLDRRHPGDHVGGRLDPGRPAGSDLRRLRRLRRLGRGHTRCYPTRSFPRSFHRP